MPNMQRMNIILIAEADHATRNLLEIALRSDGHDLVTVTNGRQALEFLRNDTPDMVIASATLPLLDGYELCDRMKRIRRLREVPVVVLAEDHGDLVEQRLRSQLVKADALEVKPIASKPLRLKILDLIGASPQLPRPSSPSLELGGKWN